MDAPLSEPAPARTRKRAEHRRAPRREVLLHGLLIHGPSAQTAACVVRDVSVTGARVRLRAPQLLSRPLHLLIAKNGAGFQAEIAWCKDGELGLVFKSRLNLAEPTSEIEKTAGRLWQTMKR